MRFEAESPGTDSLVFDRFRVCERAKRRACEEFFSCGVDANGAHSCSKFFALLTKIFLCSGCLRIIANAKKCRFSRYYFDVTNAGRTRTRTRENFCAQRARWWWSTSLHFKTRARAL